MKLNLGCGNDKLEGYVNVDMHSECNPDMVCDLELFPWPWQTNSVSHVLMKHVLEHLGASSNIFLGIMKELYRVSANGCEIEIHVPHPRHDYFIGDPTHVRPITRQLLSTFSKKECAGWASKGGSNTPFAQYLDVNFEITAITTIVDEPYLTFFNEGKISREELNMLIRERNNIANEEHFTLKVIK